MAVEQGLAALKSPYVETDRSGYDILNSPLLNKGTAFTEEERDLFDLHGLLPPMVSTMDEQVARRLQALRQLPNDFERYVFLRGMQDTNEVLFYALLVRHLEELLPVVYTPTVGLGCQHFSQAFRKPRGLFLSIPHLGWSLSGHGGLRQRRPRPAVTLAVIMAVSAHARLW